MLKGKKKVGNYDTSQKAYNAMFLDADDYSAGFLPFRKTLGPLLLLTLCPFIAIFLLMVIRHYDGDFKLVFDTCVSEGLNNCLIQKFPSYNNPTARMIILICIFFSLALTRLLSFKQILGPPSPTHYINKYHSNGIVYWICINFLFLLGSKNISTYGFYSLSIIYDNYNDIVLLLCILTLILCVFLYIKGVYFPSSKDCGTSGNFIFDFYYGTELYPNILGWDVKQFTNNRFGMTFWGIACISFCAKQYELYGYVSLSMLLSVTLQLTYIIKFFIWESGYFYSIDMQHDRAGFYICWGCMVWLPSVYTISAHWLVTHLINIDYKLFFFLLFLGLFMIFINYDADKQKQKFRNSNGQMKIWGKPPRKIKAIYTDMNGQQKEGLLLASGWWGIARHFHYVPEIIAALCWSPPVHLQGVVPYLYTLFLVILLVDRSFRDDVRCFRKYGSYWVKYCELVPNRIFPFCF